MLIREKERVRVCVCVCVQVRVEQACNELEKLRVDQLQRVSVLCGLVPESCNVFEDSNGCKEV